MTDRSAARPGFHKALFGHDPSQVDAAMQELQTRLEAAERDAQAARARVRELEAQPQAGTAAFDDLGGRLAAILSLAEEEAAEQRGAAQLEAQKRHDEAMAAAENAQAEAVRYAERVRTEADLDATQVLEDARRQAKDLVDDAEREASALRAEALALMENHRATSAAAAADLERSLAARRDQAASEIAAQLAAHESSLAAAEARAVELAQQSEAAHDEARGMATAHIAQAEEQAALILQRARAQADRITRNSEREVSAATARRDSINAQLDVLRQMLASLDGPTVAGQLVGTESAASLPAGPSGGDSTDGENQPVVTERRDEPEANRSVDEEPVWYETLEGGEAMPVPAGAPPADAADRNSQRSGSGRRPRRG